MKVHLLIAIASTLFVCVNSISLLKIQREVLKEGLHRELMTNVTWLIEKPSELHCSFVIREKISKDVYIYLEEVQNLKRFEFWPHEAMDIEKPSSAAKEYEFIWRLPMHVERSFYSQWIKNYEVRVDFAEVYPIHAQIQYPMHFRYQPAKTGDDFTAVTLDSVPDVYYDCNHTALSTFSFKNDKKLKKLDFKYMTTEGNAPEPVTVMIPNARKEELQSVEFCTFGATFSAFILLTLTMVYKSYDKVRLP